MMVNEGRMISLKEWDWDLQKYVERDYPAQYAADFLNKLRNQKQWRESPDPGRSVWDMFQRFQSFLMDYRADHPAVDVSELAPKKSALRRARDMAGV